MGYVKKMVGGHIPKAFYRTRMEGRWGQGRAGNSWTDEVDMNLL